MTSFDLSMFVKKYSNWELIFIHQIQCKSTMNACHWKELVEWWMDTNTNRTH